MALNNRTIKAAIRAGKRVEIPDEQVKRLHVVVTPAGAATFAIRYRSASGRRRLRLGRFGTITVEQARKLARARIAEVDAGQDPADDSQLPARVPLDASIAAYLDTARQRLRPRTLETYAGALALLGEWASQRGVKTTADIRRERLVDLHGWLVALPKRKGEGTRSANAINRELRAIKTFLHHVRRANQLPNADRDALADTLRALSRPREQPEYLKPNQIGRLLEACSRHDAATFEETREEHAGQRVVGTTLRYRPIAPFAAILLTTGMRRGEALALRWDDIDLDALDHDGNRVGEIQLRATATKTRYARTIGLEVSPGTRRLLARMKLQSRGEQVFEGYTADMVTKARARLIADFGAPRFSWQSLRSTCGTYLTNAPAIFGAAAPFMSAKQLGHSVVVAERHYAGLLRGIPRSARTLDEAMKIEEQLTSIARQLFHTASDPEAAQGSAAAPPRPKGQGGRRH